MFVMGTGNFRGPAVFILLAGLAIVAGCAGLRPDPIYNRKKQDKEEYRDPAGRKVPKHRTPGVRKDREATKREQKAKQEKEKSTAGDRTYDDALAREVQSWWGTPYSWGGSRRGWGADCSGYVQAVMKRVYGIDLPRTASQQFRTGVSVPGNMLRRGDLVFFNLDGRGASHVGIYLGAGRFTHSSNSDGVTMNKLSDPYYRKRYIGARRVIGIR